MSFEPTYACPWCAGPIPYDPDTGIPLSPDQRRKLRGLPDPKRPTLEETLDAMAAILISHGRIVQKP